MKYNEIDQTGHQWAAIDREELASALQTALVRGPHEARRRGATAVAAIRAKFNSQAIASSLVEALPEDKCASLRQDYAGGLERDPIDWFANRYGSRRREESGEAASVDTSRRKTPIQIL